MSQLICHQNHMKTLNLLIFFSEQCKAMGPLIDAELEKIDR